MSQKSHRNHSQKSRNSSLTRGSIQKKTNEIPKMKERARLLQKQMMFERRILFVCTGVIGIAAIVWLFSITTPYWYWIHKGDFKDGIYVNETKRFFQASHTGLFKVCREAIGNSTVKGNVTIVEIIDAANSTSNFDEELTTSVVNETMVHSPLRHFRRCKFHNVFPTDMQLKADPSLDRTIISEHSNLKWIFSIVSLGIMIMGFMFSIYTFRNPRYMFKRLAGGIHFISALTVLVVIEVLISSLTHIRQSLPYAYPRQATQSYGYSFVLAWICFGLNIVAGIAFMWYSKKRKGLKAPSEEVAMADQPTIIGR
ncbi:uncharacterized protein [Bemisia tabaci]|uniref:uncharacterized protein n=1 Tax=Bemisia tabaci TaxID=7038 RepID=UPI003B27D3B9